MRLICHISYVEYSFLPGTDLMLRTQQTTAAQGPFLIPAELECFFFFQRGPPLGLFM